MNLRIKKDHHAFGIIGIGLFFLVLIIIEDLGSQTWFALIVDIGVIILGLAFLVEKKHD